MSTYICSDLHGQYTLFMKMLDKIEFSNNDTLYVLGDIIDRGPKSMRLFNYIMSQDNMICIIGNHEHMMWTYFRGNDHDYGNAWKHPSNGGYKTSKQFYNLSKKEQERILDFIEDMYLQIEVEENNKKFLLSHSSCIIDKDTVKWKDCSNFEVERTVWYSPWRRYEYESFEHYKWDNRIHVIGHVPVQNIRYNESTAITDAEAMKDANILKEIAKENIINIDGGCAHKSKKLFSNCGIICMNLSNYINDNENVFTYIK